MNISTDFPVMIFKNEYQGNTFYSLGLSKKDTEGKYINGYMPCQFKKSVSVEDKTKIYIKSAWLTFYLKEKETKPYIFINEFETVEETIQKSKEPTEAQILNSVVNDEDPYVQMSYKTNTDELDLELPF